MRIEYRSGQSYYIFVPLPGRREQEQRAENIRPDPDLWKSDKDKTLHKILNDPNSWKDIA